MCSHKELPRPTTENGEDKIGNPSSMDFSSELDGRSTLLESSGTNISQGVQEIGGAAMGYFRAE